MEEESRKSNIAAVEDNSYSGGSQTEIDVKPKKASLNADAPIYIPRFNRNEPCHFPFGPPVPSCANVYGQFDQRPCYRPVLADYWTPFVAGNNFPPQPRIEFTSGQQVSVNRSSDHKFRPHARYRTDFAPTDINGNGKQHEPRTKPISGKRLTKNQIVQVGESSFAKPKGKNKQAPTVEGFFESEQEEFWTADVRHVGIQLQWVLGKPPAPENKPTPPISYSAAVKKAATVKPILEPKMEPESIPSPPVIATVPPPQPATSRKKKPSKSVALGDFLLTLTSPDKKVAPSVRAIKEKERPVAKETTKCVEKPALASHHGNVLDGSTPIFHKGKQRENKKKRPSKLKKTILQERETRKNPDGTNAILEASENDVMEKPSDQSSNVQKSDVSEECATSAITVKTQKRKFRDNVLSKDLDARTTAAIREIGRFQDRLYAKDPDKARLKKRIVYGLREVCKLLIVDKIKCVIIAPNVESISAEGGLDEKLENILDLCGTKNVPYFFALNKMKLGYISHKHSPISCAGIMNYQGADELYKSMMECAQEAKDAFLKKQSSSNGVEIETHVSDEIIDS